MSSLKPPSCAELQDVTFHYPRLRRAAVSHVDWHIPSRRTLLLGPNGAGKSTLLQLIAGVLRPTKGKIVAAPTFRIGYMPQHIRPVPTMTALEQVAYCGWLRGMNSAQSRSAAAEALDRVGLSDLTTEKSTSLSGGQLRRVGIAQALVGESDLLLLDEPTAGLDPAQRANLAEVIGDLAMPTIVSTHQVEDIEETFDDVIVMVDGAFAYTGSVVDFLDQDHSGAKNPIHAYTAIIAAHGSDR